MKFLAQVRPPRGPQAADPAPFWAEAARSERWLREADLCPPVPALRLRARSLARLAPWADRFPARFRLEAKFDEFPVAQGWRYLSTFLAPDAELEVEVPLGGLASVLATPQRVRWRLPHASPYQRLAQLLWDSPEVYDEVAWTVHGLPQAARLTTWGSLLRRHFSTGLTELVAVAHPDHRQVLAALWENTAAQLGHQGVVLRWWQPHGLPRREQLLGIDFRLIWAELHAQPAGRPPFGSLPEPWGLQAVITWAGLQRSPEWMVDLTLRRFGAATRLEVAYQLTRPAPSPAALRVLGQDRRRLGLTDLRKLKPPDPLSSYGLFARARAEAKARQEIDAIGHCLARWGETLPAKAAKRRRGGWTPLAALGQPGVWTFYHAALNVIAEVYPPRPVHPGTIVLEWPDGTRASLLELDPWGRIDRFKADWRYWLSVLEALLTPALMASRAGVPVAAPAPGQPDRR